MNQMTLDELLEVEPVSIPELICCSLSKGFHWLKITSGCTPLKFKEHIDFKLGGYDHLYINTELKEEMTEAFNGEVVIVQYRKGE